jgi:hypothetical protein
MTAFTTSWSLPPPVANSCWYYSMHTKAVSLGSKIKSAMVARLLTKQGLLCDEGSGINESILDQNMEKSMPKEANEKIIG